MRRALLSFCAAAALIGTSAAPAAADAWGDIEVMDDAEMADMRGGLAIAPGLDVQFGAVITTYAGNQQVLETALTWTDAGAVVEHTYGQIGVPIDSLPADSRALLGIEGMAGAGGVVILDSDGVTAMMHNVTSGVLQNIILNNANGRDLRQDIDITLALPNFEAIQNLNALRHLGLSLDADMAGASAF